MKVLGSFLRKALLLLILFSSCKEEKSQSNISMLNTKEKKMLEDILKNQLIAGNSPEYPYDYSTNDLEVTLPILQKSLVENNFKFPTKEQFNDKIFLIFKRKIDFNSDSKFLYVNYLDKCNKELQFSLNDRVNFSGTYIVKKSLFISDLFSIPLIVDYQKEYPNISTIEDEPIKIEDNVEDNDVEVKKWKDVDNLSELRKKNIQKTVHRNKYLFNDDKASLTWLKTNDVEFLEILVKTFGYVEDKELTKFVLDKNLKDDEEFGKVIWTKTCDGKLHFNEEIVKVIKDSPQKYIEPVENYLRYLYNSNDSDLAFSQKAEIMGKLAYHLTKIVDNQSNDYYNFFPSVSSEEFQKEFESKNYYNIKDFQSIYEETKTGGVAYPGME